MNTFWEDLAMDLLEKNLNGDSLNADSMRKLFAPQPHILDELNLTYGDSAVDDIDKALYGGRPQVIEIREAKPNEVYHCKACNRTFKRGDNFRRHLTSSLHARRNRAMELAMQEERDDQSKVKKEED